jgi:hypothetical protein
MATDSSLGTLGVNIAAYAGQFMAELTRAENGMSKFQRSISKTLTKAGLDTIGLGNAARAMSNELKYVWNNIESIPGIDPLTIASVQEMKTEVEDFRNTIHSLVADGMSLFAQLGKSIGLVAGAMATAFKNTSLTDMFTNPTMMAANFAVALQDVDSALKSEFDTAVQAAQAQNQLADSTARATAAKKDALSILSLITKQNEEFARSEAAQLERLKADGESIRRDMNTPLEEWGDQLIRLDGLLKAGAISQETFNRAMRAADMKKKQGEMDESAARVSSLQDAVFGHLDGIEVEADQTAVRVDNAFERLGEGMSESMSRSLLGMRGGFDDFGDFASSVVQDLLAELIQAQMQAIVMQPLLGALKGGGTGIFGSILGGIGGLLGFADGGRPPVRRPSVVGERGPELFVPDMPGTIIPNHKLSRAGAAGAGGNTYYIDARGTDESVVQRLGAALHELAGPGVVERRAVYAVYEHRRRGGAAV